MDYKKLIIDLLGKINDQDFLRKIYTIIIHHIRKMGN